MWWSLVALMLVAAPKNDGAICLKPFRTDAHYPPMSQETWAPSPGSKFIFRIDKRITRTVAEGEAAEIRDIPTNRKVLVQITLDGKPFESFRLDLRKEKRRCLRLDPGYWHWIEGCRCGAR